MTWSVSVRPFFSQTPIKVTRLTAKTEEQREARLQRVRANQSERLAAETEEHREARL